MSLATGKSLCIDVLNSLSSADFILYRMNRAFEISGRFVSDDVIEIEPFERLIDWRESFLKSDMPNWTGNPDNFSDEMIEAAANLKDNLVLIIIDILEKNAIP